MNETASQWAYTGEEMVRYVTWLLCASWLLSAAAGAELPPAKGRLLVATEGVIGDVFVETVILLLHYDESGAMGLVVNRPTEVALGELLDDVAESSGHERTVYWGGPVEMDSLSALMRVDTPAEDADEVVASVYRIPVDDALKDAAAGPESVRFYLGYAGWAGGQLDYELARGTWHVVPASDDIVFAEDPKRLWQRLKPVQEYRAALQLCAVMLARC